MKKTFSRLVTLLLLSNIIIFSLTGCNNQKASNVDSTINITQNDCIIHSDIDDNGLCDVCNQSVITTIDFYAINDLHGKFNDSDGQPGVDELTTYLKECIATENTIFLSSGDMWQGSTESNLTKGAIITDWMNELGFVSMTLGNHEFDWGTDYIIENSKNAKYKTLAINVFDKETKQRVKYCEPSVMVERDGIKIGIIGAIGDCYSSISSDKSKEIYFVTDDELTELVKEEATKLKSEGADIIVYSIHDGYNKSIAAVSQIPDNMLSSYYDIALSQEYVDIVFEGHTHSSYTLIDKMGVYHLQNGGENKGISHVEYSINTVTKSKSVTKAEFIKNLEYSKKESDSLRDELLSKYSDLISFATEKIGITSKDVGKDTLRDLVAELYYNAGIEKWGDDYDIVLGGGYISCRSPYYLAEGNVTYGDIQSLFPFDNEIVLCSIKGKDLDRVFFNTNNKNYFMFYGDYGAKVEKNIDPNMIYYVIVDTYSSSYEPNKLTEVERLGENIYARDLLAEYIKKGGLE